MAEHYTFITHGGAPWVHGQGAMTPSRLRSLSPMPKKEIRHSVSVPHLANKSSHAQLQSESEGINTIPDPRSVTPQPPSRKDSSDSHPDLSQEVSTLSTKLINAINHSTMLDDSLQQTRIELEEAREQLQRLEARVMEHEDKISKGLLVDKIVYDKMEKQLTSEMHEERKRRVDAELAKRKTDGEVEALTAALFEEANIMVASARKETEASEKRGEHLKQQLVDAEVLQNSLQEQLRDFKNAVEKMTANGEDNESGTLGTATEPSTPGITPSDKMAKLFEAVNLTPNTPGMDDINPDQPLVFSHLIRPILRSDLVAFNEFLDMLKISQRSSAPSSRVSSANYGSLNVLGLGSLTNSSTSSLPGFGLGKSPDSASGSPRDSNASNGLPNLKDDKFFKRALAEDIEPTLRLDIAPGLSWLARRTAINSITAGSLVVEPNPTPISKWRTPIFPCSLCGEQRKGDEYARKFRFKLSDTEEAQRYPLCDWCMGRVRATCDYIGFLRMVAAGHWRAETEDEQKSTWEESVRLRERMFWTRIGGGVVPSFVPMRDSPASPTFANGTSEEKDTMEPEANGYDEEVFEPRDVSLSAGGPVQQPQAEPTTVEQDPFQPKSTDTKTKRISIGKAIIMNPSDSTSTTNNNHLSVQTPTTIPEVPTSSSSSVISSSTATVLTSEEEKRIEEEAEAQLHNELRKSLDMRKISTTAYLHHKRATSNPPQSVMGHKKNREDRLSLMIPSGSMPGAFE